MKRFFFAAAAALLASIPSASATPKPSIFTGLDENHMAIVEQSFAHGVPVVLDTETCLNEGMAGYYNGRVIAICMTGNGWDEENKDTLRHEAHHMVQDCLVDGLPDFQYPGNKTLFTDPVDFALRGADFTERQIQQIYITYAGFGLDEADILIEVEAWAVAASVDAADIAHSLDQLCK